MIWCGVVWWECGSVVRRAAHAEGCVRRRWAGVWQTQSKAWARRWGRSATEEGNKALVKQ
ncbi:hypothetical protein E2C01_074135 [Portunus trituberculatus]|uniref:Uncharacterized protein n=1 Tax=Portunus trituberculatus TaxID=210409 RepID=A0A5B7ICI4_PORTR|nr:hypothetical protein [Portunus trituberculatus]